MSVPYKIVAPFWRAAVREAFMKMRTDPMFNGGDGPIEHLAVPRREPFIHTAWDDQDSNGVYWRRKQQMMIDPLEELQRKHKNLLENANRLIDTNAALAEENKLLTAANERLADQLKTVIADKEYFRQAIDAMNKRS